MSEQLSSTNTSNSDRYDESSTEKSQDSQNQDRVSGTTVIADEDDGPLTVRALVSTKEAGVIIGKGELTYVARLSGYIVLNGDEIKRRQERCRA